MTHPVTIDAALRDPMLLGAALGDAAPWRTWLAVLRATFGLPLDADDAAIFAKVAGGREPPRSRVKELHAAVSRRGGKTRMGAATACQIAAFEDHRSKLAAGETGHILVLAPTKDQAALAFNYIRGFFEQSPILRQQIENVSANELRLTGNIVVGVHPASFRTVRGRTLLAAIFDETAFMRDESSATPDIELYRAVLPALATTGGMLISISSPYRRAGLLFTKHRDHFGKNGDDVLVIQGASGVFNPTLDASIIDRARESDPESAKSEWDAEFRSDLSQLFDDAIIDAAIEHGRPLELPPRPGIQYVAFADASAGRHDAFTFCIGHREGDRDNGNFVADVVRGRRAPFDPNEVAAEYAKLAKEYRVSWIVGDSFAGEFVTSAFRAAGATYTRCGLPKSGLYLEALSHFMRGAVTIPNLPPLIRELRLLERRVHRSGKDSVDAPRGISEDHANALAGAIYEALHTPKKTAGVWGNETPAPVSARKPRFEYRERADGSGRDFVVLDAGDSGSASRDGDLVTTFLGKPIKVV